MCACHSKSAFGLQKHQYYGGKPHSAVEETHNIPGKRGCCSTSFLETPHASRPGVLVAHVTLFSFFPSFCTFFWSFCQRENRSRSARVREPKTSSSCEEGFWGTFFTCLVAHMAFITVNKEKKYQKEQFAHRTHVPPRRGHSVGPISHTRIYTNTKLPKYDQDKKQINKGHSNNNKKEQ